MWTFCNTCSDFYTEKTGASLPAAFVVGPLVLLREKYPCNTMQVQRYAESTMIALTDETDYYVAICLASVTQAFY